MDPSEHSGLLRPIRQPVSLPTDERPPEHRRLLVVIAVVLLVTGIGGGLTYRLLWRDVGHEITRLLPASTLLYVRINRPWEQLDRALDLDRWPDPTQLRRLGRTTGLLGDAAGGIYGGIPLRVLRGLIQRAESLRIAVVPTTQGMAKLVVLVPRIKEGERRLLAVLERFMRPVDRQFGVAIHALEVPPGPIPWSTPPTPIHVVVLDGRLIFCVGPEEALEALLKSRVAGHGHPIRRRVGFDAAAAEDEADDLWAFFDVTIVAEALEPILKDLAADPVAWRANLVETFRTLNARSAVSRSDESLEIRVGLRSTTRSSTSATLGGGSHELLSHIPIAADLVVSLSLDEPLDVGRLFSALHQAPGVPRATGDTTRMWHQISERLKDSLLPTDSATRPVLAGRDVLLALLRNQRDPEGVAPDEGWILAVKLIASGQAQEVTEEVIPLVTLPRQTRGEIYDGEGTLHVVAPSREHPGSSALAWRIHDDLLLVASDPSLLELAGEWVPDTSTSRSDLPLRGAMASLPGGAPVVVAVGAPYLRRLVSGLTHEPNVILSRLERVLDLLSPDFTVALALGIEGEELVLHSNLGIWTVAAAMASWDALHLAGTLTGSLPPGCREAYNQLCKATSSLSLCRHFQRASRKVVLNTCERLLRLQIPTGPGP